MNPAIQKRIDILEKMFEDGRQRSILESDGMRRQISDLRTGHERGLVWREDEAARSVAFCKLLKQWKKPFNGKPLALSPWQDHCVFAPLFGWYKADGTRRFRQGYKEVATTECAAIALQGLIADQEAGAEVYCAATMRDQATILLSDSQNMIRQSPQLSKHVSVYKYSITCEKNAATFKPLSSDHNSLHGLNISRAVVDEVHSHKSRDLWDVLVTSTGTRVNPLIIGITTAGYDRSSICWELHEYTRKVNAGILENDEWFGFIACADPDDDPFDPATWHKANPNLDISIQSSYLKGEAKKAKDSPSYENTFRRLHLCQWTEQDIRWIPMADWDACREEYNQESLQGESCYAALDLASTRDVNALILFFPESNRVLPFYWVPEEAHDDRARQDRQQVMNWANNGFIRKTPGNVTDYATVVRDIMELSKQYQFTQLGYDSWGPASALVQQLESAGFDSSKLVEVRQGYSSLAAATKELERMVVGRTFRHNGDPVLRWMAGNVTVKQDPAGNIKPDKSKSSDKIDGIVATVMAIAMKMADDTVLNWYVPGKLAL